VDVCARRLEESYAKVIKDIPLSNDTINEGVLMLLADVTAQLINQVLSLNGWIDRCIKPGRFTGVCEVH
jgi:hypothetical protein